MATATAEEKNLALSAKQLATAKKILQLYDGIVGDLRKELDGTFTPHDDAFKCAYERKFGRHTYVFTLTDHKVQHKCFPYLDHVHMNVIGNKIKPSLIQEYDLRFVFHHVGEGVVTFEHPKYPHGVGTGVEAIRQAVNDGSLPTFEGEPTRAFELFDMLGEYI